MLAPIIIVKFLKKLMNRFLRLAISTATFAFIGFNAQAAEKLPSWYLQQKQNNSEDLYGVAEGATQEEATRFALADAASRLLVTISSTSNLIREESKTNTQSSINEEMRQSVRQNVEKIEFSNFEISNSARFENKFYNEVKINRSTFIKDHQEKLNLIEKKLDNLAQNSATQNPIQKRSNLIKSQALAKELELYARILHGAGFNINLSEKLDRVAKIENEMNKNLDKIEFFFEISSPQNLIKIIRAALNKEKIAVAKKKNSKNPNQIVIAISSEQKTTEVYGSFITKVKLNFSNSLEGKILASSSVEISGSSVIDKEESYDAALKNLEEKIASDGILKTVGILD
jgi:hypothetical protein